MEGGGLLSSLVKMFKNPNNDPDAPIIPVMGILGNGFPELYEDFGLCTNYDTILSKLQAFEQSKATVAILYINSPGGYCDNQLLEVSKTIRQIQENGKTLTAFVDNLCASAAYWVASSASRIYAKNKMTQIGSIGTYVPVYDFSQMYASMGIEVTLLSSGGIKGQGVQGVPISDEAKTAWQDEVEFLTQFFIDEVNTGRKKNLSGLATGELWYAEEAVKVGLADVIENLEIGITRIESGSEFYASREQSQPPAQVEPSQESPAGSITPPQKPQTFVNPPMPQQVDQKTNIMALLSTFSDIGFVKQCIERNLSVDQAKALAFDYFNMKDKVMVEGLPAISAPDTSQSIGLSYSIPQGQTVKDMIKEIQAAQGGIDYTEASKILAKREPALFAAYRRGEIR